MLANNCAPQCLSSVSSFSPCVVSYLSSGERELQIPWDKYEDAKQNYCFLEKKTLFNIDRLGTLLLVDQIDTSAAPE